MYAIQTRKSMLNIVFMGNFDLEVSYSKNNLNKIRKRETDAYIKRTNNRAAGRAAQMV